jgi:hypothetical protein
MRIAFFGSSLVSAYWNGAATYYRGIIRALHERGHQVTFYEPDAYGRQQNRDISDPEWARVVVYPGEGEEGVYRCLEDARGADLVVKASGVGVFDGLLEAAVLDLQRPGTLVVFWDVDAPATLDRVENDPTDPATIVLSWASASCDTSHQLVIDADGRTMRMFRPTCQGDALGGLGHVLRLTFDGPAPAGEFDVTLETTP